MILSAAELDKMEEYGRYLDVDDDGICYRTVPGTHPTKGSFFTRGTFRANRDLIYLGVSGDGDTASIGMWQFIHSIRRNMNMVYIVMNNGCYGLTKGQDSATADFGSINKAGDKNIFPAIDLVGLAMELEATFVGRSFSGDKDLRFADFILGK